MPKDENKKTVRQKDADELYVTTTPSPTVPPTIVEATDFDIRDLSKVQDEVYAVLKTDAGVAYDARDRSWTITETIPVSATDLDIRDLAKAQDEIYEVLKTDAGVAYDGRDRSWTITENLTVTDISSIKTAVEKIDNQEDSIRYVHVSKSVIDGDIIATPGVGFFLRIHHIYVNNEGANITTFELEDGTTAIWRYCLAAIGGAVAQNLKRPWDLTENRALHYDHIGGLMAAINITIGYETVAT